MARIKRSEKDEARGERFRAICQGLFPGQPRAYIADRLGGVSGGSIRNWELGQSISPDALAILDRMGVSLDYLLKGEGAPMRQLADGDGEDKPIAVEADDSKYVARVIGANLKFLRKQRFSGWGGQKKFADFLNISANDLCVYEYGRSIPNEDRLAEIAKRLELAPEQLRNPLPGVAVPPPANAGETPTMLAGAEKLWRERLDDLKQKVARLEGRLEAVQEQNTRQQDQIRQLQEANYVLRHLVYLDDSAEAKERREKLMERLEPSISDLVKRGEAF